MEAFKKKFLYVIPNIKLRSVKNTFQKELKGDIPKIKQSWNAFVFPDKTSDINEMPEQQNKKLFMAKPQKREKAPTKLEASINVEAKNIA